jgi:hypothetical protein
MKYQFIQEDTDTSILKYKDKEFTIKRDVELVSKLQSVNRDARLSMYADLVKKGISKDDLVITTKKDGKTYVDNSYLDELEKQYLKDEQYNLFNDLCKTYFNMSMEELVIDIGLKPDESQKFGTELGEAISGKGTPREEK